MNPVGSDLLVNIPLTLISSAYIEGANEFIADQVFGVIPVQKRSGTYYTFDIDSWYRTEAQERAPATESVGSGFTISQAPLYNCRVYAFHKDVDDITRAEQDANGIFDLDAVSTRFVTRQLLLKRELVFANAYMVPSVWGKTVTGTSGSPTYGTSFKYFSDAASTPIDEIGNAVEDIRELTGLAPNVFVITPRIKRALRRNPQLLDAAKSIAPYTGDPRVTDQLLAELLEVEKIVVARTIVNSAPEGATKSMGPLYGKNALLVYASSEPSTQNPSGGYIFSWTGYPGADYSGNRVSSFRIPEIRSDRIEGEIAFDARIVAPDLGRFYQNVIP